MTKGIWSVHGTLQDGLVMDSSGGQPIRETHGLDHGYPTPRPMRGQSKDEWEEQNARRLFGWWREAVNVHADNRAEMAEDDDYVDHIQWTEQELMDFEEQGRTPLIFNEVQGAILWIAGTERRTRVDGKVLPRTEDDVKPAKIKSDVMKYLSDANGYPWVKSAAFEDAVRVGVGIIEVGVREDETEEPVFLRTETWRRCWWDAFSTEPDWSDLRYFWRRKVLDLDVAMAMFPEHAERLRLLQFQGDWPTDMDEHEHDPAAHLYEQGRAAPVGGHHPDWGSGEIRPQVALLECWYRTPHDVTVIGEGDYRGQVLNPRNPRHQSLSGGASLYDAVRMMTRVAIMTEHGQLITDELSPYVHNRIPFVPVWGYRRRRDNMPYGVVRGIKMAQKDLNKRRSVALQKYATKRTVMEEGAVDDIDDYAEQVSRPDGIIVKRAGKELEIFDNISSAREDVELARQDGEYIRQASGVTGENLGLETNATSGRAILARQNQGTTVTAPLFDNYRRGIQLAGEQTLSLVEQYYNQQRVLRLTDERGNPEFVPINGVDENGNAVNDITGRMSDFQVSDQDYRESLRQAQFEAMMDVVSKMPPEVALQLLDLVMESSDLSNRDEIVKRIRTINGQVDPDDLEQQEAAQQMAAQRQQMQDRAQQIEMAMAEAKAKREAAEAEHARAKTLVQLLDAKIKAMEAGTTINKNPSAAMRGGDLEGIIDQERMSDAA